MGASAPGAELRAVAWRPVLGLTLAAVTLLGLDLSVWPQGPGATPAWLAAALLAGAACFALDQPAAGIVASSPTSRTRRTAVRAAIGLAAWSIWVGYAALWRAQLSVAVPQWWAQALVGGGLVLLALGLCATLVRSGQVEPAGGVTGGLVLAVIGLAVMPLPWGLQVFDLAGTRGSTTVFWVAVAVVGAGGLVWGGRDEGTRPQGIRTRPPGPRVRSVCR